MPDILLEILSEEIPARMQVQASTDLEKLVLDGLVKHNLPFSDSSAYVTPRRLALIVKGLPIRQPDRREERRGPRVDAPKKAIAGFTANLPEGASINERETKKGIFLFAILKNQGALTAMVLPEVLEGAIRSLSWPKSMRIGSGLERWIRPIQRILCVFNNEIVPISYAGIKSGNQTQGHRFLAPKPFKVNNVKNYIDGLHSRKVMLEHTERSKFILEQSEQLAKKSGLFLRRDLRLVEEVAGLVEWPSVLLGEIDKKFLDLPDEILISSMRKHQKYLICTNKDNSLSNRFIIVSNMETKDSGKGVISGNERVLRARLSDAAFFWDQDRKCTLRSRIPALKDRIFHAKIGTIAEKVERMGTLALHIGKYIPEVDNDLILVAASLAKADLSTGMVGEFPELQGIIGRYYALHDGESPDVADAVAQHYSPTGPEDGCQTRPLSIAIGLADKIDSLVGFWSINEKPTGSKDPYALRRASLGIIRLIIENKLRVPLLKIFKLSQNNFSIDVDLSRELMSFLVERMKVYLRDKGERHDVIEAVFSLDDEDDLIRLMSRFRALSQFLDHGDGGPLLEGYRRIANIVRIEERKDGCKFSEVSTNDFEEEDIILWEKLNNTEGTIEVALKDEKFREALEALTQLGPSINNFFDKVKINTENASIRSNRLGLLQEIIRLNDRVADLSKIEGGDKTIPKSP